MLKRLYEGKPELLRIRTISCLPLAFMDSQNTFEKQMNVETNSTRCKQIPPNVYKDGVKWSLKVPKVALQVLCLWPESQNKITHFVNFFYFISFVIFLVGQFEFILDKDTDIGSSVDAITGFMASFEGTYRQLLGIILAKKFSTILAKIYYDFWPSDIAGEALHLELVRGSWILVTAMACEAMTGFIWTFQSGLTPLSLHQLPLKSKFRFPYSGSPFYELIYVWQAYMVAVVISNIAFFDFFLVILIWHCVTQFKILKTFLEVKFDEIIKRTNDGVVRNRAEAIDLVLLIIRRHNDLINTCKELESMLVIYILILYLVTIGTVCLSSFLLRVAKDEVGKAIPYFCGHLLQVFLYCFYGNELILESTALSNSVAQCGWHLRSYDRDLEKSLILIMVRAQKPVTISVGGFGVLSLASYMKLLQFCFSVYAVLNSTV